MIVTSSASVTRPANTDAYASGDEISNSTTAGSANPLVFSGLTENMFGTGKILNAKITASGQGFTGEIRLYLFNDEPTMSGDNSPYAIQSADAPNFLGFIGFASAFLSPTGSQVSVQFNSSTTHVVVSKDRDGSNPIYGVLVANGAITPTSGQTFTVELFCEPYVTTN